jgi:hypothetical protein
MPCSIIGLEAIDFVKKYLDIAKSREFDDEKEVISYCSKFPLILKISSEKLVHKTETNSVVKVVNKEHLISVLKDFKIIAEKFKLGKFKYFVQEYVSGIEFLLGIKKDASFGHVVVFGLGGIFVELLKDIQFRVVPLKKEDVLDIFSQLKNKNILEGFRCLPKPNKDLLIKTILSVSKMAVENPKISELDINPLICNDKVCKAVDVRIVFD